MTAEDIVHGKPNPEIYLLAAERLGGEPSQLIVFEGSVAGCLAAGSAGAFPVVVLAEHNKSATFPKAKLAVDILDDPQIISILERKTPKKP